MEKKVLIVEDQTWVHNHYHRKLDDKVSVISAFSIEEAETLFAANPDIAAIVLDACVPGNRPNTPPLARKFRSVFAGPMIATSSDKGYRQDLVAAGCDSESLKENLPEKLLQVLGL
jgi:DNA-binding NarL/FixJ family response regulator